MKVTVFEDEFLNILIRDGILSEARHITHGDGLMNIHNYDGSVILTFKHSKTKYFQYTKVGLVLVPEHIKLEELAESLFFVLHIGLQTDYDKPSFKLYSDGNYVTAVKGAKELFAYHEANKHLGLTFKITL